MGLILMSFIPVIRTNLGNDFRRLEGPWEGHLMYLDYTSNKNVEIPANLVVQKGEGANTWYFKNDYPREPHANSIDTIVISEDGKMINREKVTQHTKFLGKTRVVATEHRVDEGTAKDLRFIYIISAKRFSVQKEERKSGEKNYIIRNRYEYFR